MKIRLEKKQLSIIFIIIFHIVGIIGFMVPPMYDLFISLVPYHLLLMAGILIINQREFSKSFWITALTISVSGFIVELLGVNTGKIFGEYVYGETLGTKLADIPLVIGINWFIMVFSIGSFLKRKFKHQPNVKSLVGAFALVIMDILIEPVAIKHDYWRWIDYSVPFQNYVGWFVVSFLMLRFYYAMDFKKTNSVGLVLFVTQLVFFVCLNIMEL